MPCEFLQKATNTQSQRYDLSWDCMHHLSTSAAGAGYAEAKVVVAVVGVVVVAVEWG